MVVESCYYMRHVAAPCNVPWARFAVIRATCFFYQWRRFMPNSGGPGRGSGGRESSSGPRGSPPEAVSFSVYSGPKIPCCFPTQSVL